MGAKPFKTLEGSSCTVQKTDMKHFPFFCSNFCLTRGPKRCLTLSLGFVIQQIFFSLLGSNIIVYAVEEILFVVIIFFTKAVNDTKQGFGLFLQSVEHYVSCKERKYIGFYCGLQSCLLAGCPREVVCTQL